MTEPTCAKCGWPKSDPCHVAARAGQGPYHGFVASSASVPSPREATSEPPTDASFIEEARRDFGWEVDTRRDGFTLEGLRGALLDCRRYAPAAFHAALNVAEARLATASPSPSTGAPTPGGDEPLAPTCERPHCRKINLCAFIDCYERRAGGLATGAGTTEPTRCTICDKAAGEHILVEESRGAQHLYCYPFDKATTGEDAVAEFTTPRVCAEDCPYPAAARSIALNLGEFCDESLAYPEMIADAARKACDELASLRAENDRLRGILANCTCGLAGALTSDPETPALSGDTPNG